MHIKSGCATRCSFATACLVDLSSYGNNTSKQSAVLQVATLMPNIIASFALPTSILEACGTGCTQHSLNSVFPVIAMFVPPVSVAPDLAFVRQAMLVACNGAQREHQHKASAQSCACRALLCHSAHIAQQQHQGQVQPQR